MVLKSMCKQETLVTWQPSLNSTEIWQMFVLVQIQHTNRTGERESEEFILCLVHDTCSIGDVGSRIFQTCF